mgnify:CR=1 FL=1
MLVDVVEETKNVRIGLKIELRSENKDPSKEFSGGYVASVEGGSKLSETYTINLSVLCELVQ